MLKNFAIILGLVTSLSACVGTFGYDGYGDSRYGYNGPANYGYGYNAPVYYGVGPSTQHGTGAMTVTRLAWHHSGVR